MSRSILQHIAGRGRKHGIRRLAVLQHALAAFTILIVPFFSMGAAAQSTTPSANISFASLEMCSDSSYDMSKYGSEDVLAPCILYDIRDFSHSDPAFVPEAVDVVDRTSEITLVQVTPSNCHNHRDGAATAVKFLNADNDGMGIPIGYYQDHYVKFRLVSIVGGNAKNIGDDTYREDHGFLLDSVFDEIGNAHYILGTCSGQSIADKPIALKREKVVISQVGPPGFYRDFQTNPYVFGIHVNSDTYPLPALQALKFYLKETSTATSLQPVRVIYGNYAEFFYSTCRSVIDEAAEQEFDVVDIEYDPNTDDLESLADQLCPSTNGNSTDDAGFGDQLPPAIFACVKNDEANVILDRLRSNGCRPSSSWFTTATWQWASDNPDAVPYFQGAGQWHKNFKYSDNFFDSGQDVLDYGLEEFGYTGSYDHVVSYAIPNLIADLIQTFFRIDDFPDIADALSNRYDDLRKALSFINAHTIFGPVSFNEYQRNDGRGAAGVQWMPTSYGDTSVVVRTENDGVGFVLGLTSPGDQADAAIIIPSPSGSTCLPGNFVDQTLIELDPSLLEKKCSPCPIDSYLSEENVDLQCLACPEGSSTLGDIGATSCFQTNPNLIPKGLKAMGYLFVAISWSLAIGYIVWMIVHRNDSVIKIGQPEFLFFICVGAIISTSAIIPLTIAEADVDEDTTKASRNCQAIPFLYSLGWVIMYSSLTAKSYRLTKVAHAAARMQRLKITARQMYKIIIAFLILDAIILIAWQLTDPLLYTRTESIKSVDEETGIVTLETVGQCTSNSLWKFFGPIIAIHGCLMVITNVLLWRVRDMSDRYQEQKFVALASLYTCELLLLGVPIILVQSTAAARYIVIAGVIFLTDTGVLSLIFIPKIKFQSEGLPQGVSVIQSMNVRSSVMAQQSRYNLQSSIQETSRQASISEKNEDPISIDRDTSTKRDTSLPAASTSSAEIIEEKKD
jgi:hypothetical protein